MIKLEDFSNNKKFIKHLSVEKLDNFSIWVDDDRTSVRQAIAKNPYTPEDCLEILKNDINPSVRLLVEIRNYHEPDYFYITHMYDNDALIL